jgi:hypothetical protein
MFSKEELEIIHANTIYRLTNDKLIFEREKELSKRVFDKVSKLITNDTPALTETPIEELKEGQSVWCVQTINLDGFKKGDRCIFIRVEDEKKCYCVAPNNYCDWVSKNKFYEYFTTIQPNTTIPPATNTPKPKIDRAELLDVAKCYATANVIPIHAVALSIVLLNEVNKACNATI